jgi:aryl-alcohol dehydrogenase-like predicted oxidoreductase
MGNRWRVGTYVRAGRARRAAQGDRFRSQSYRYADVYGDGRSERLIARLKKERKEEMVVATKARPASAASNRRRLQSREPDPVD